ncbi:21013_t:CDS:2, partial [Cetraspora pellucida]
ERWGPHTIDRMADYQNSKLPHFNSRYYCPNSEGINCFTQNWKEENNYVCPPLALIHRVLQHIIEEKAVATGGFRCSGTMEESKLAVPSSKARLVSMLLARAQTLRKNSVSQNWNQRLDRAWCLYDNYCKVMGLEALPSKVDTLVSFIVWLDLTHAFSNCTDVLAAVSREHLEAQLPDPSKNYKVKKVFRALFK